MKIRYGYYEEESQMELTNMENKTKIKDQVEDLMQIYDWVTVVNEEGKDVTVEFC